MCGSVCTITSLVNINKMNLPNLIIVVPASRIKLSPNLSFLGYSGHPPNTTTSVSSGLITKTAVERSNLGFRPGTEIYKTKHNHVISSLIKKFLTLVVEYHT